ncbi:tenascin-like [Rhipicephalus sanguineus]|uniref:tenascin-like n=1 Tax=Rhipicephalus sanguineus TaxID=34632 RepID=UPI00189620C7|nr:tenascin-like [Rhipicephalus sanguineus]
MGVAACLAAILICLASLLLVHGKPSSRAEPLTKFDLPDVRNLVLLSSTDNSITVTWERPEVRFDYYWVSISADSREKNTTMKQHYMGSCSNGTIIHASQNRVTCTNIDACTNVKFTVRTHINGPPERTSEGATIGGIFIAGKDPDAPRNITAIGISRTLTRVQWAPPSNLTETQTVYAVRVCPNFTSCDGELNGCKENQTSHTWLEFESTVDTTHCVVVVANAQCGPRMLRSPKGMSVVRTPSFAPPDVTNLTIINVGAEFFTVGWTRPEAAFDYYSVELKSPEIQKLSSIGSCANGAIIHRDRTELTCTELEPWIIYELRLHTHITGPPARTSSGRTAVIVTNKKVAPEVSNLKVENIRGTSFVVTWERPKESIEYYTVEVTDHGSGHIGDRFHSIVSCNNGAAINPRQTSLTCTKSDTCTSVSVRVKTHTRGPPEIESPGVTLENVLLPGTELPEVTDLKLTTAKNDSFTVTFQAPEDCVDVFHYNITDHNSPRRKVEDKGCTQRNTANNIFQVTCTGIEACHKVDFAVGSRKLKQPSRDSPGVAIRGIEIRGKCNG